MEADERDRKREKEELEEIRQRLLAEGHPDPDAELQRVSYYHIRNSILLRLSGHKYWKQPKCPSANEWIQKLWYIYTMEFYAAERNKELIPFATAWMELESIMLSEISQAVRDKYHMISPLTGT